MAARRLLIVMLVLLGISTLAAALIPQRPINDGTTTATTMTTPTTTTPAVETVPPAAEITVGGRQFPVVPVRVGDQFTLLVLSRRPNEVAIPEFGLIGFATPETPARFELLPTSTGKFGILFPASGKPVGQIEVTERSAKKTAQGKKGRRARSRARAGSGQA